MRKLLLFIVILCIPCAAWAEDNEGIVRKYSSSKPFNSGEIIVKFKSVPQDKSILPSTTGTFGISQTSKINEKPKVKKLFKHEKNKYSASMYGVSQTEDKVNEPGVYRLIYDNKQDLFSMVEKLKNDPDVEYAEPNYIYQVVDTPNDPSYSLQWALAKIGAPSAWDVTKGQSDVIIAVIDTGVDYTHQDLAANMWVNKNEIENNGIDDDGNGYTDDVRGWNFVNVPSDWLMPGEHGGPDNDPMDVMGHGTHVSGIAAGLPNNNIGIAGTAWNSKIMPLRAGYVYIDGGGYLELADIAEAIYYAADNGASVINMSFGSLYDSILLRGAIDSAHSKGCILVASAGNVDSYDVGKPFYPAAYDHVIAVAAVDRDDKLSIWNMMAFSNFGSFVDICAPGTSILSTLPGNSYGYASGTSMAAPYVSGLAALVKAKYKYMTPDEVEQRIKDTSDNIYGINPQSFLQGNLGSGRINAKRALGNLSMAITYPKPTSIISGSVAVIGSANMENFTSYKLECSSVSDPDKWETIVENEKRAVDNGLLSVWSVSNTDGQYNLRLTVTNASGETYQTISGVNFGVNGEVKLSAKPQCGPSPYNPEKGQLLFYYDLLAASDVDIYVYDTSGTLVWQRKMSNDTEGGSAGTNRVFWDGVDGFGETLNNGAYLYMIVAKDKGDRKIIGRGKFAVIRG